MFRTHKLQKSLRFLTLALFVIFSGPSAMAASINNSTRLALQSELRSYISTKTTSGAYTFFDEDNGSIQELKIKAIHPVIFVKGDRFLMCADFIDQKGKKVVIDYVMLPVKDGFIIEKELEGQRPKLMEIFEKLL